MFQKKKKGTILFIEAVIYIAVVMIFVFGGLGLYSHIQQTSKIKRAQAELTDIAQAVSHYRYDMGKYPASLEDLTATTGDAATEYHGPWLTELKTSPWNNSPYQYQIYPSGRRFVVFIQNNGEAGSPPSENTLSQVSSRHITDEGTIFVVGH